MPVRLHFPASLAARLDQMIKFWPGKDKLCVDLRDGSLNGADLSERWSFLPFYTLLPHLMHTLVLFRIWT